ncbi:DNA polymerase [Myxococcus sp. XM-1-1-1]|uniref:DNA polymerase n=1 Tax=Myxococcus sp. XM-1-1-1 TaxID=2874602 RepID=UPI001CBECC60|nr:DNA polymerase [Myxococcus sp. XM-1-1-1]MBZ4414343.1 DNA polymerase [Myxococcus sp. XM-1-1-1]
MDDAFIRAHEGVLVSSTLEPPKRGARQVGDALILGFDVEWDSHHPGRKLLSVQLAGMRDGQAVSHVFDPPGAHLTVGDLVMMVREFIARHGLVVPVRKNQPRKVYLVAHFAAAEISKFKDPVGELLIHAIGKAHHATMPRVALDDGEWELRVVDLFAFFAVGLEKVALLVGREKLVVDRTGLRRLKEEDPETFRRYAATDAEIVLEAFLAFRAQMRHRWGVDPLMYPSLASLTAAAFRYGFLRSTPAPVEYEEETYSRKTKRGFQEARRQVPRFAGDRAVRIAALRAIHGGRVEVFIRGLYIAPLVERDVVSLYPSAARLQPLPHEKTRWRRVKSLDEVRELEGFGRFKFKFPRDTRYPVLPVKGKSLLFPLSGVSDATFAEVRLAMQMGAELKVVEAYGFSPGPRERDHDVGRYVEALFVEKSAAERGSLQYRLAKNMLNSFIGKLGEHERGGGLLAIETAHRRAGFPAGAASAMRRSRTLRELMRQPPMPGSLYAPEWYALVIGRARALMAELLQKGAVLISTDALVAGADVDFSGPALDALKSMGSDFLIEHEADAIVTSRARVYGLLQKADSIRPGETVLARNGTWAVVRVARHASIEDKSQFAETLLICIQKGTEEAAPVRQRVRLISVEEAVREGKHINEEVVEEGRTLFRWDNKRRQVNRDVNIFASWTDTQPYASKQRKLGADHQRKVRAGQARRKYRPVGPLKRQQAEKLLAAGAGVRSVAKSTGIPKSTVADIKRQLLAKSNGSTKASLSTDGHGAHHPGRRTP